MKSKTLTLAALAAGVLTLGALVSGCTTTEATAVATPNSPADAIVRVTSTVNKLDPSLKRFALATETPNRTTAAAQDDLFTTIRTALEQRGYDYTSDTDRADFVVFVNYGYGAPIDRPLASSDLGVVERRVEVLRRDPITGEPTVVSRTTTTPVATLESDARYIQNAYVDLSAFNQKSLKRDPLWQTQIEGLSWSTAKAHDLPRLAGAAAQYMGVATNGTVRLELR